MHTNPAPTAWVPHTKLIRPPPAPDAVVDPELIAREIAARLVVSENTVKTHVRHVLAKLDAGSRGAAVARARRQHLL